MIGDASSLSTFLTVAAAIVILFVAIGLARALHGPTDLDRLMAVQLLGSGGAGALVLWAVASGEFSVLDVALTLGVLAAFASIAFFKFTPGAVDRDDPASTRD